MPKAIAGSLQPLNSGSLEWGWHGFLAYGSHSLVVVLCADTMNLVQTLVGHRGTVVKVRWYKESVPKDEALADSYDWYLRMASADSEGAVIIWDVMHGIRKRAFGEPGAGVVDMHWLQWQDASSDLLAVLHQPATLILWNADQGTQLWKTVYDDSPLVAMALDPFAFSRVAFLNSSGNLILLTDFSLSAVPNAFGRPYRVAPGSQSQELGQGDSVDVVSKKSIMSLNLKKQLVRALTAANVVPHSASAKQTFGEGGTIDDTAGEEITRQVVFHASKRGHLFLLLSRDIILVNITRMQVMVNLAFDRHIPPVVTILTCSTRDAFYLFHENGMISLRLRKYGSISTDMLSPLPVTYEALCCTDTQLKGQKVVGACLEPQSELQSALIMSSGRVVKFKLYTASKNSRSYARLDELISLRHDMSQCVKFPLKFFMEGTTAAIGSSANVLRVCPSWDGTKHQLAAIGHMDGLVQLIDLRNGEIRRDFTLHSCAVRCLEWCGPDYLISAGYQQSFGSPAIVRNEVLISDIRSGAVKSIRPEQEESPVELLRVSHFCSYLAIAFRRQPLEIWDLRSFRLLRKMSRRCPIVVDMAWSSKHHQVQKLVTDMPNAGSAEGSKVVRDLYRENLVVLDMENHLWHVVVKGMHVRDGQEVQTQWATGGTVTAMIWKQDLLVFGDNDGRVSCWNIEAKASTAGVPRFGSVKRLRFCTFPDDFRAVALHAEGITCWDPRKMTCLAQTSFADIGMRCLDVDITEDGQPVALTSEGNVRVYGPGFALINDNVEESLLSTTFCPFLCSRAGAACIRRLLQTLHSMAVLKSEEPLENVKLSENLLDRLVDVVRVSGLEEHEQVRVLKQLHCIDKDKLMELARVEDKLERNLLVASLFGEEWSMVFWKLLRFVIHYKEGADALDLPLSFDYFLPNGAFRASERLLCATFDFKQSTSEQLQQHITTLILLGEYEAAVQVLIEADSCRPEYFADCLKACLLSSDRSLPECQSTIKLVATNLIAGGKLTDGVQLLRMIDKSVDACRYLQSFGLWEQSVWVAKVALDPDASTSALMKWADHLCSSEACQKSYALLLLLSLSQYSKVLNLLLSMRQITTAACFVDVLETMADSSLLKSIPQSLLDLARAENVSLLKLSGQLT